MGSCFPKAQLPLQTETSGDLDVQPEGEGPTSIVQLNVDHHENGGPNCPMEREDLFIPRCNFAKKYNDYEYVRELGNGKISTVKLYRHSVDGQEYAVKIYSKEMLKKYPMFPNKRKAIWDDIALECKIMMGLKHKNVVGLIDYMKNESKDKIYLVMEYMAGGPIMNIQVGKTVECFTEDKARKYFCDIVKGLEYIHNSKIIHLDIKPSNILLSHDDVAKITDFSESFQFYGENDDIILKSAGTPAFTPPELRRDDGTPCHGRPVDIWGLGLCLCCFVTGKFPYTAHQIQNFYNKYQNAPVKLPKLSNDLQDLLRNISNIDPNLRYTIQDIKNHPWVSGQF